MEAIEPAEVEAIEEVQLWPSVCTLRSNSTLLLPEAIAEAVTSKAFSFQAFDTLSCRSERNQRAGEEGKNKSRKQKGQS